MKENKNLEENSWRPNWRDPAQYPNPDLEITTMQEWAWEFLRRNHSYQDEYIKFKNIVKETKYGDEWFTALTQHSLVQQQEDGTYELFNKIDEITILCMEKYFVGCSKGGLPDPSLPYKEAGTRFLNDAYVRFYDEQKRNRPNGIYFDTPWIVDKEQASAIIEQMNEDTCKRNEEKKLTLSVSPTKLLVEISLEGNLKNQISFIKQIAKAQHKKLSAWGIIKTSSKQPGAYQHYLRLLDALEEMEPKEIKKQWEFWYPGEINNSLENQPEKKLNQSINSALDLCALGYMKLVRLPEN